MYYRNIGIINTMIAPIIIYILLGAAILFVYQKALMQTFHTSFLTTQ